MRSQFLFALAAMVLGATASNAQVTGVVTSTTATVTFRPDVSGNNIVDSYSGQQIAAANGDNAFGSGGNFASTSMLAPGLVAFENGNASSGAYTYLTSQTDVDVTYTNNTSHVVTPQLQSQIVPAGLGVYVGFQCLATLTSCPEYNQNRTFQSFSPDQTAAPLGNNLAGASIDFKILSNGVAVYDLSAALDLVYDPSTGQNVFVDNFAQAQATLNGFGLETTPGSATQYGFNWQATNINVAFPQGTQLQPNQSATLTYQTTVQTYSRADCFQLMTNGCLISYSSFGDPIGGGMGIKPSAHIPGFAASGFTPGDPIATLMFQNFAFNYPTFQNGVLSYQLAAVPEPKTWALALFGAGLIGAALRRRRGDVAQGRRNAHSGLMAAGAQRYRAFVSYSHRDKALAAWLHHALETYRLPPRLVGAETPLGPAPRRLTPIFRDRDELPASGDLGRELTAALENAMFLVVICSPGAAASPWVEKEILAFKGLHGDDRVLALIVDGEPYASGMPGPRGGRMLSSRPALPAGAERRPVGCLRRAHRRRFAPGWRWTTLGQTETRRRPHRPAARRTCAARGTAPDAPAGRGRLGGLGRHGVRRRLGDLRRRPKS